MSADWYRSDRWSSAPKHIVSAAVTVLDPDGKLLLVKSPSRGWEVPGGIVELGEPVTKAAIREVEEESGIRIVITAYCGIFQTVSRSICNLMFTGRPTGGTLRHGTEAVDAGWFSLPEALDRITYMNFRRRVEMSLDAAQWPFLVEYDE